MRNLIAQELLQFMFNLIEAFIDENVDTECPHCHRILNLPDEEQIENWLKGEK